MKHAEPSDNDVSFTGVASCGDLIACSTRAGGLLLYDRRQGSAVKTLRGLHDKKISGTFCQRFVLYIELQNCKF